MKKFLSLFTMLAFLSVANVWGVENDIAYTLDFTAKSASCSNYTDTWTYGDFSLYGGANNSGSWGYVRFGGKGCSGKNCTGNSDLESSITATKTITNKIVKKVTIEHAQVTNNNYTAQKCTLVVASNSDFSTVVDTRIIDSPVKSGTSFDLTPNTVSTWPANAYYKIIITCNVAGKSNVGVEISKIKFIEGASVTPPSCDKSLSLTKSVSGNGSFNVYQGSVSNSNQIAFTNNAASVDNCGSGTTTLVVVPTANTHYHVSNVEATNIKTGTSITQSNGQYTIQYAQGGNVSSSITVTFAEDPHSSIVLNDANGDGSPITNKYVGETYTLPTTATSCTGKTFVGWSTVEVSKTNTKPTSNFYEPGATYENLPASIKFYAVYAKVTGTIDTYKKISQTSELTNGLSVIIMNGTKALENDDWLYEATPTIENGLITSDASGIIWTYNTISGGFTLKNTSGKYLKAQNVKNEYITLADASYTWTFSEEADFVLKGSDNRYLEYYNSAFTSYGSYSSNNASCYQMDIYIPNWSLSSYATGCEACTENPTVGAAGLKSAGAYGLDGVEVSVSGMSTGSDACEWTDYGFVWGTSATPTVSDHKVQVGTSGDATSFDATLAFEAPNQFAAGTTYYFRAYGKNSKSGAAIAYGTEASFTPQSVTFNMNGHGSQVATQYVNNGGTATDPGTTSITGYTFNGWKLNSSAYSFSTPVTGNITLVADWSIKSHTITWATDGDALTGDYIGKSGKVNYGTTIVAPTPTKTGYNFAGWTPSVAATMPDNDVTYTATWTAKTTAITLNKNNEDAEGSNAGLASWTYDKTTKNSITAATRTGYSVSGYYSAASGGTKILNADGSLAGNAITIDEVVYTNDGKWAYNGTELTLYAHWTANTYKVVFKANGGTGDDVEQTGFTYDESKTLTSLETIGFTAPEHKYFLGWNTNSSATTAAYEDEASVSNLSSTNNGSVNLYAIWKAHTYTNYRTLCCTPWDDPTLGWNTFSLDAGGSHATLNAIEETTHGTLTFASTNESVITVNETTGEVTPVGAGTAKVTATWVDGEGTYCEKVMESETFTVTGNVVVTFKKNGGEGTDDQTQNIPLNTEKALTSLEDIGYTAQTCKQFVGWNTDKDATSALYTDGAKVTLSEGITLYAIWEDITYTVSKGTNTGAGTFTVASSVTCGQDLTITCAADDYHEGLPTISATNGTYTSITDVTATSATINGISGNITVNISYAAKETHALKFMNFEDGEYKAVETRNKYAGAAYGELPTLASNKACDGTSTTFKGWTTSKIDIKTGTEPTYISAETVMGSEDIEVYAVWAKQEGEGGYELVSSPTLNKTYVFVSSNTAGSAYALTATGLPTTAGNADGVSVTIAADGIRKYISTENEDIEFTYSAVSAGKMTLDITASTSSEMLVINGSGLGKVTTNNKAFWDNDGLYGTNNKGDKSYHVYWDATASKFKDAESTSNGRVYAYEKQEITYSDYVTGCRDDVRTITIADNIVGGTVGASASLAFANDDITLTKTPASGYNFSSWAVVDAEEGTVTVTNDAFTMPDKNVTVNAVFTPKPVESISLSESSVTEEITKGSKTLTASYLPNDLIASQKTLNWATSDASVATVENGVVTYEGAGTATITASWTQDENVKATCEFTIYQWNLRAVDPYEVTTAPGTVYTDASTLDKSAVVVKANYVRSDNDEEKQETLGNSDWIAKLGGTEIAHNYAFQVTDNGKTLAVYVGGNKLWEQTIAVTAVPKDEFVVGLWDVAAPAIQTGTYTMPSLSNQTAGAAATCKDHNIFIGWVEAEFADEPEGHIIEGGTTGQTASNKTYYAVWAKQELRNTPHIATTSSMATSGDIDTYISYSSTKGSGTTNPGIYSSCLRIYKPSSGNTYGGYITISASDSYNITAVEISTSESSPSIAYRSGIYNASDMTNGSVSNYKFTLSNLSTSTFVFANRSSDAINISQIKVTYSKEQLENVDYITECVTRYDIEFYADETLTDKVDAKKYKDGKVIAMPDKYIGMSKDYHTFAGWRSYNDYSASVDKVYAVGDVYTVAAEDFIYGEWTPFSQGTVTIDGETLEGSPFYATQSYTLPTPEAISGKRFIGWSDGENIVAPGEYTMPDPATNIIYTSQWFDLLPTPSSISFTEGEWILVTNENQLHAGDIVVIASTEMDTDDKYYALSTSQGTNNRGRALVTINGDRLTYESAVAPLFLQNGYGDNQYALYDILGNQKYLQAASKTQNYLHSTDDITKDASWLISFEDNGTYVEAQGENTHNSIRYNKSSDMFSAYAVNHQSPSQTAVAIYKWIETVKPEGEVNASDVMPTYNVNLVVQTNTAIDMNVERTVNDFIIEAMEGESGQITHPEKLNINGNAYYDLTLNTSGTMDNSLWYAFAVPFQVDAATGIQRLSNDGVASPAQFNGHYVLLKYNSSNRASTGEGWEYVTAGETLDPGKFYMIALNSNAYNRVRMTKKAGASVNNMANLTLSMYSAADSKNANWNAIANNALAYANVSATGANAGLKVQVYNSATDNYSALAYNEVTFTVGTPFFLQAAEEGTMSVVTGENNHETLKAPAHYAVSTEEFQIRLGENTESYYDILYVSASEEALNEYQIGHDLAKAGVSKTVPQMYVPAYGAKLCDAEFPLENNEATFPLTFTAPNAGTYQLYVAEAAQDAELYLMQNNSIVWNLTLSPYEIALPQGTTEGYSLLLKAKAPSVVTGVDQIDAKAGAQKVIIDEHVYILRGGQMYDVNGKMVK